MASAPLTVCGPSLSPTRAAAVHALPGSTIPWRKGTQVPARAPSGADAWPRCAAAAFRSGSAAVPPRARAKRPWPSRLLPRPDPGADWPPAQRAPVAVAGAGALRSRSHGGIEAAGAMGGLGTGAGVAQLPEQPRCHRLLTAGRMDYVPGDAHWVACASPRWLRTALLGWMASAAQLSRAGPAGCPSP